MRIPTALLLALSVGACGEAGDSGPYPPDHVDPHDVRAEFLDKAAGDAWANWPADLRGDPTDERQSCARVSEQSREEAIRLLARRSAVEVDAGRHTVLTGEPPKAAGTLFLLRGFSTTNSTARVKVKDGAVVLHSDAVGGLFNLRRHPCIAVLPGPPSAVYSVVSYDL